MTEKQELTEEQISQIKIKSGGGLLGSDVIDEDKKTELKKKRIQSGSNGIILCQLFLLSYDVFKDNLHLFADESEDKKELDKVLGKHLSNYVKHVEKIRNLVEDYGSGFEVGAYFTGEKIKDYVRTHREEMNKLINLFFRVFGSD